MDDEKLKTPPPSKDSSPKPCTSGVIDQEEKNHENDSTYSCKAVHTYVLSYSCSKFCIYV